MSKMDAPTELEAHFLPLMLEDSTVYQAKETRRRKLEDSTVYQARDQTKMALLFQRAFRVLALLTNDC